MLRTTFPADHAILTGELAQERARLHRAGIGPAVVAAAARRGRRAARPWVRLAAAELRVRDWRGSAPPGHGRWPADGVPPIEDLAEGAEVLLLEGAGGLLSPITWEWSVVELARSLVPRPKEARAAV